MTSRVLGQYQEISVVVKTSMKKQVEHQSIQTLISLKLPFIRMISGSLELKIHKGRQRFQSSMVNVGVKKVKTGNGTEKPEGEKDGNFNKGTVHQE
ncbi:hypothetical protein RIR_jg8382.t1 [Rhizophagus irregularis DAOM 181602=DAOM 197198]|nr:hypothetical protein RIR_jg8382.t1 [Rhizophagus irregularis DAOM 181602=DAOM 197198]